MAGLTRLDEKHKRIVELRMRGTPVQQICAEAGISRSTLHNYLRDPLMIAYSETLINEQAVRRSIRLDPAITETIDLYLATIREGLRQRSSDNPEERLKAPSLKDLVHAIQVIHGLERLDAGAPTTITESRSAPAEGVPPAASLPSRSLLELLLDGVVVDGAGVHPLIDVTPTETPEPNPEEND